MPYLPCLQSGVIGHGVFGIPQEHRASTTTGGQDLIVFQIESEAQMYKVQ